MLAEYLVGDRRSRWQSITYQIISSCRQQIGDSFLVILSFLNSLPPLNSRTSKGRVQQTLSIISSPTAVLSFSVISTDPPQTDARRTI